MARDQIVKELDKRRELLISCKDNEKKLELQKEVESLLKQLFPKKAVVD